MIASGGANMPNPHIWDRSHELNIQTGPDIVGGFSIGFDDGISEETKDQLMHYAHWVEDHYHMPVTLWVDFEYKHYLRQENGKKTNYRFYCVDFVTFPVFTQEPDIPVIRLPVRGNIEAVLAAFTEAITLYFTWLANEKPTSDPATVKAVMDTYRAYCKETGHTF
jgi:hypothetical protein